MDSSYRALIRPGYLLAALLVIAPIADTVISVWPLRFSDEQWRFGAVGAFSNITLVSLLGLFLGVTLAVIFDHGRTRKLIGWFSAVTALVSGVVFMIFILDYFQTRAGIQAQAQSAVDIFTYISIGKQLLTILTLIFLSRVGLGGPPAVSPKRSKRSTTESDADETPLIPLSGGARSE